MKIFIAGEGSDEIGDWAKDPAYLPATPAGGVVESLLRRIRNQGWQIAGGCPWRRIRKLKAGRDLHEYERCNVFGAIDQATEAGCDAIAFVRDRDGDVDRERAIEAAIEQAPQRGFTLAVIGGVAIETTDAWILALLGDSRSEHEGDPKRRLREVHGIADGLQKAEVAVAANLLALPTDAISLRCWIERAESFLGDVEGCGSAE